MRQEVSVCHNAGIKHVFLTLFISVILLFSAKITLAQEAIKWPQTGAIQIAAYSSYLIDKSDTLTIADVSKKQFQNRFEAYPWQQLKLRRTLHPVWLKFSINNRSSKAETLALGFHSSTFDYIDFYQVSGDKKIKQENLGDKQRKPGTGTIYTVAHDVKIMPNSENSFYVKLKTSGSMRLAISLSSPANHNQTIERRALHIGLYYGIFLCLILMHIALFWHKPRKYHAYHLASCFAFVSIFLIHDGFINHWFGQFLAIPNLTEDTPIYLFIGFISFFSADIVAHKKVLRAKNSASRRIFMVTGIIALIAAGHTLTQEVLLGTGTQYRTLIFIIICTIFTINYCISLAQNKPWHLSVLFNIGITTITMAALISSEFLHTSYSEGVFEFKALSLIQLSSTVYILAKIRVQEYLFSKKHDQKQDFNLSRDMEIGQLVSNISSNMRTPLSGVTGMVDLLKTTSLNERQMHCVKIIEKSSQDMVKIIDDASDYNSINIEATELKPKLFNLEDCIINACHPLQISAITHKLEIIHQRDIDISYDFYGDEQKIQKVIMKLLNAAIDRSKNDKIIIYSKIKSSPSEGAIRVYIEICYRDKPMDRSWESPMKNLIEHTAKPDALQDLEVCKRIVKHLKGELNTSTKADRTQLYFHLDMEPGPLKPNTSKNALTDYSCLLVGPRGEFSEHLIRHLESWKMRCRHIDNFDEIDKELLIRENFDCAIIDLDESLIANGLSQHFIREHQELLPPTALLSMSPRQHPSLSNDYKWITVIQSKPIHIEELKTQLKKLVKHERQDSGDYISLNPSPRFDGTKGNHAIPGAESIRVLIAEDNLVNRQVSKSLLNRLGAQTFFVVNGAEAMVKLCEIERDYDIVFMDGDMPEMSGYEATEKIRQFEKRNNLKPIPIVAITAHASDEYREKAKNAGMTGFINKPISLETLRRELIKLTALEQRSNIVRIKAP